MRRLTTVLATLLAAAAALPAHPAGAGGATSAIAGSVRADPRVVHGTWSVRRQDGLIVIAALNAPRLELARELAALTNTQLLDTPEHMSATRLVTLSWRGQQAGDAWARLLGDEVSHATHCSTVGCRVWIVGPVPGTPPAAGTGRRHPVTHERHAAPPEFDPPGLFPAD